MLRPLVLEDLHQYQVKLSQKDPLSLHRFRIGGGLDDDRDNVILNSIALFTRQGIPARLDELVEDLESQKLRAIQPITRKWCTFV